MANIDYLYDWHHPIYLFTERYPNTNVEDDRFVETMIGKKEMCRC